MIRPNPYFLPGSDVLTRHLPTPKVTMGRGALRQLANMQGERIALVMDAFLVESGFFANLCNDVLADADYQFVCGVAAEPSYASMDPYVDVVRDYAPTVIVAIGGGSTMDTAKGLWARYECPERSWDEICAFGNPMHFSGKARLVCVPTTSGTGSEATGAAVYARYDGTKALLIDQAIRPSEVFLDFDLTDTLPGPAIANAGIDALAHVLGAMTLTSCNPLDKMVCTEVAVSIIENLVASYDGDRSARERMHVCAYLAGDEINNAGGGFEHKLDMFAKAYHIPHGVIMGVFLPYTMLYLMGEGHYVEVARQLGIQGKTAEELSRGLVDRIWSMYDHLGLPKTIREAGVPEDEFLAQVDQWIEMVKGIGHIYWLKGFKGDESLRPLYFQAYYGLEG